MARAAVLGALLLACLCGSALAIPVGTGQAKLNVFKQQTTISLDATEQNPYGLYPVNITQGSLVAGNFLATNWNDAQGNPGQGRTILQITPDGCQTPFATIDPNNTIIANNCGPDGVGLTMALVVLSQGYVVVGSTPVAKGNTTAGPGCLIVLSANGTVLDAHGSYEQTNSPGVMTGGGPWAFAVQEFNLGTLASLFVSYVLGDNPTSTDTLTGVHGGMVVRYTLQLPGGNVGENFWGAAPEVVASGFPTAPGNITAGAVGPSGLVMGVPSSSGAYSKDLANQPLFIANTLNNSIDVVPFSTSCFQSRHNCIASPVAWGGVISGPVGIAEAPDAGSIVGANGGDGLLFEIAPTANANSLLAVSLVDNANAQGGGNLFNVMFHPMSPSMLFFNDDGTNSFNVLAPTAVPAMCPSTGRKLRFF